MANCTVDASEPYNTRMRGTRWGLIKAAAARSAGALLCCSTAVERMCLCQEHSCRVHACVSAGVTRRGPAARQPHAAAAATPFHHSRWAALHVAQRPVPCSIHPLLHPHLCTTTCTTHHCCIPPPSPPPSPCYHNHQLHKHPNTCPTPHHHPPSPTSPHRRLLPQAPLLDITDAPPLPAHPHCRRPLPRALLLGQLLVPQGPAGLRAGAACSAAGGQHAAPGGAPWLCT